MPVVVIYHKLHKGLKPCNYPLAKIHVEDPKDAHDAVWMYQRQKLVPIDAPPCGGCDRRVDNQIGFYFQAPQPPPSAAAPAPLLSAKVDARAKVKKAA